MHNEVVALKYKADRVIAVGIPISIGKLLRRAPVDGKVAAGVTVKTADDVKQRGLSAPRRAKNRYKFMLSEVDADTAQRGDCRISRNIGFYNVTQGKQGFSSLMLE